jgi:hypothetical protein
VIAGLKPEYTIRSAKIEELPQLATIEQAAAIRFQDTPYAFLADGEPLPIEFIQQRFQAGQVWVAVDRDDIVIGFAITREVDRTLYLQEIDIAPDCRLGAATRNPTPPNAKPNASECWVTLRCTQPTVLLPDYTLAFPPPPTLN